MRRALEKGGAEEVPAPVSHLAVGGDAHPAHGAAGLHLHGAHHQRPETGDNVTSAKHRTFDTFLYFSCYNISSSKYSLFIVLFYLLIAMLFIWNLFCVNYCRFYFLLESKPHISLHHQEKQNIDIQKLFGTTCCELIPRASAWAELLCSVFLTGCPGKTDGSFPPRCAAAVSGQQASQHKI